MMIRAALLLALALALACVQARKKKMTPTSVVLKTSGDIDYKATFDNLSREGCQACVAAGYGWNVGTERCGGFENDRCPGGGAAAVDDDDDDWDDEVNDDLDGFATPGDSTEDAHDADAEVDYAQVFAQLTQKGCVACVKAGYGWSPDKNRCGGFANTVCDGVVVEADEEALAEVEPDPQAQAHAGWKDTDDTTKLWKLISGGQYDALKLLLEETPSLATVRSSDGRGPLFWAHEYSQKKMASLLAFNGADATATDKDGRTPGDIADSSAPLDHGSAEENEGATEGGTDMGTLFRKLTQEGCRKCVNAGYGWCPIKNICGGFANRNCHDGLDKEGKDDGDDLDDDLEGFARRV
jgi:hypothetical protein